MIKSVHHPAYKELIAQLVAARKACGLTTRELSQRLGEAQPFVTKIETGARKLSLIEFMQYAEAVGISEAKALEMLKVMNRKLK